MLKVVSNSSPLIHLGKIGLLDLLAEQFHQILIPRAVWQEAVEEGGDEPEARSSLATYADQVAKEPVIITVNGKPVAALVAIDNADLETVSLSTNPEFLALIERSRACQEAEGGISSEEMRRRPGMND